MADWWRNSGPLRRSDCRPGDQRPNLRSTPHCGPPCERGRTIVDRLAKAVPGNADWQRFFCVQRAPWQGRSGISASGQIWEENLEPIRGLFNDRRKIACHGYSFRNETPDCRSILRNVPGGMSLTGCARVAVLGRMPEVVETAVWSHQTPPGRLLQPQGRIDC